MSLVDDLVAGRLADPHALLGVHGTNGATVVRTWRPEAETVRIRLSPRAKAVEATQVHPAGLFEAKVRTAPKGPGYEVEVAYPDGNVFTVQDPWSFAPTLGELDLHLAGEGRHEELWERLGAHVRELDGVTGTAFAVWAPGAQAVSVVGDFNSWDGRLHPMRSMGPTGIWELFVPGVAEGAHYKFEIRTPSGEVRLKADPLAQRAERPPQTASIVHRSRYEWADDSWMEARAERVPHREPMSVYEVHLGSWKRDPQDPEAILDWDAAGEQLAEYVTDMGFTHVELLPVMQHPFSGSWGYQVSGYFAPDSRHGDPDGLKRMVDRLHANGVGVLLDWVPAHFPRDDWALARFDGTALYEHEDPRRGAHKDWGTLIPNFGRHEVRNFFLASGLFWPREYHVDGLRVDAVASMLYLDYSREPGEWVPNAHGGREDLEAVAFLRELNEALHAREPGVISAAEESTAWPGVSRPTYVGGLGFGFKWNMGWMHDTLGYFGRDPIHRRYHHHELTFSLVYAFSEEYILPLSHDEVVHGKGSLLDRMPGDKWQKLANLRALYALQWSHPGKQLIFMGCEFAQEREWSHERSLDWHLLEDPGHAGMQRLVRELNRAYVAEPALFEVDGSPEGFEWVEAHDAENSVMAYLRWDAARERCVLVVANLTPLPREGYRVGLPRGGRWREVLNTDAEAFGGSGVGNCGSVEAEELPWHGQPHSAPMALPPLGVLWFVPE
jgi:1,4-alpha-glucan branching enzyme